MASPPGLLALTVLMATIAAATPGMGQPAGPAPDGMWTVSGQRIPGMRCGDWLVRLTNMQGQLTGAVALDQATVPIDNMMLRPDGSFSGATRPGVVNSRHVRAYRVSGRFSGDTVNVTIETDLCPARFGVGRRQALY